MNEEILEGLKQATAKGEPIESAVETFKNAGYSAIEVDEAANILKTGQVPQTDKKTVSANKVKIITKPKKTGQPIQQVSSYGTFSKNPQVSKYDSQKKVSIFKRKWFIVTMGIILLFLILFYSDLSFLEIF